MNVWIALAATQHVHHGILRRWLESVDGPGTILFCRATQQAYLRLLTTAAVLSPYGLDALTNREAWEAYEALISDDRIVLRSDEPPETERFWRLYSSRQTSSPKVWMDSYLAAFARAASCSLVTLDAGLRRFEDLDVILLHP